MPEPRQKFTSEELRWMCRTTLNDGLGLTSWECDFLTGMYKRILNKQSISEEQSAKIDQIYTERTKL
jgi:hypothetical protein